MTCGLKKHIWLIVTSVLGVFVMLVVMFYAEIADDYPVARFELGIVLGLTNESGYSSFKGIPYAKINRTNRFGVSFPYGKFKTHYEAYYYKSKDLCPCSRDNGSLDSTSDCLYLNIYIPNTNKTNLPVLANIISDKAKEPEFDNIKDLLEQNILIVNVHYRTGIYGFMCLNSHQVPGNQGFKDQILALKWIRNYIQAFGGDPENITVVENTIEDHGIDFHLIYGESNLFDRIIINNATAFYPSVIHAPNDTVPIILSKELGCENNNTDDALLFLSSINEAMLIKASENLDIKHKPCVEKQVDNEESFITEWADKTSNLHKTNVTVLILQNKELNNATYTEFNNNITSFNNVLRRFNVEENNIKKLESIVRKTYVNNITNVANVRKGVKEFAKDMYNYYPVRKGIKKYLENGAKVYYGLYSNAEQLNSLSKVFTENDYDKNPNVTRYLRTILRNFIKNGDPSPEVLKTPSLKWQEVTKDKIHYLDIDSEVQISLENIPKNETRKDTSLSKINKILINLN